MHASRPADKRADRKGTDETDRPTDRRALEAEPEWNATKATHAARRKQTDNTDPTWKLSSDGLQLKLSMLQGPGADLQNKDRRQNTREKREAAWKLSQMNCNYSQACSKALAHEGAKQRAQKEQREGYLGAELRPDGTP